MDGDYYYENLKDMRMEDGTEHDQVSQSLLMLAKYKPKYRFVFIRITIHKTMIDIFVHGIKF